MPATYTQTLEISCDNPAGPHADLDPSVREGWLFAHVQVAGGALPVERVFCQEACLAAFAALAAEGEASWSAPPAEA